MLLLLPHALICHRRGTEFGDVRARACLLACAQSPCAHYSHLTGLLCSELLLKEGLIGFLPIAELFIVAKSSHSDRVPRCLVVSVAKEDFVLLLFKVCKLLFQQLHLALDDLNRLILISLTLPPSFIHLLDKFLLCDHVLLSLGQPRDNLLPETQRPKLEHASIFHADMSYDSRLRPS